MSESTPESDDILGLLRDSADDFCERSLDRGRLRTLRGTQPAFDRAHWVSMAELGWLGVTIPEEMGGLSLGPSGSAAIARALGRVAAPEPFIESGVAAATVFAFCEADEDLINNLMTGEAVTTVALGSTGTEAFSTVAADRRDDVVRLDGVLNSVPLGSDADSWLVPATLEEGPAWFLVTPDESGVQIERRILSDGSSDARVVLNECAGRLLAAGDPARDAMRAARTAVGLASSAYQLGIADTLFAMTVEYVSTRRQFGQAIGSFQALQHRLVDTYLSLRVAEAVVEECVADAEQANFGVTAELAASRARYQSGETLIAMAREAIQLHGAIGYTDECDVSLFVDRALVLASRYGRSDAHVARIVELGPPIAPPMDASQAHDNALANLDPPNGDWNALDNDTFRNVVRQWHTENYPDSLKNLRHRVRWEQCSDWYARLYERGFAAPGWPREHGGMGLTPEKLLIFIEERERLGVVRTPDQGIIMVGPLLMKHGTPEQQAYYLPKALSAEHIWCQGYSEPNAGSDLASLMTSAVRDGDEFVINGQKIWTTMAQDANQMFCLVRTDPEAKPQAGISFVLIDFTSPGITVRPIRNIAGDEEFCEVFFDDVRVPVSNLVGELNDGWTIAKNLLGFERFFIGSPKMCRNALGRAAELMLARQLDTDPVTVDRFTRFKLDVTALEALYKQFADVIRRGEIPGADISLLKIFASETMQRLSEFVMDLGGEGAAQVDGVDSGDAAIDALFPYYNARPTTIYGGSNEIQRNILAKFVLRLPSH